MCSALKRTIVLGLMAAGANSTAAWVGGWGGVGGLCVGLFVYVQWVLLVAAKQISTAYPGQ